MMFSDFLEWLWKLNTLGQILVGIIGLITTIGIWEFSKSYFKKWGEQYFKERQILKNLKSNRTKYKDILRKEVDSLEFLIPGLEGKTVLLSEETFVHLRLSRDLKTDEHMHPGDIERYKEDSADLKPEEILNKAFKNSDNRVVLFVGDPGSGKTTLIKYFVKIILSKNGHKKLNIKKSVYPVLFYLRNLNLNGKSFYENLEEWTSERHNKIEAGFFENLLTTTDNKNDYYLFLDGIDEAGNKESRKKVCQFIDNLVTGLPENVKFIVSTRSTGINNRENILLTCPHIRADLKDFNEDQKIEFLRKWLTEITKEENIQTEIDTQVKNVIDYINQPENKDIKDITGIPIILTLLALIWYKFKKKPDNRSQIYKHALDYFLQFRDDQRNIQPLVDTGSARKILQPVSLSMQKDELDKIEVAQFEESAVEQIKKNNLKTLSKEEIKVKELSEYLVKRASILSMQANNYFVFKHKSFREYFAGVEIEHLRTSAEIGSLITNLDNPWWLETTKYFFENISGVESFNLFFSSFFKHENSKKYLTNISSLIVDFVKLAPFKNEKIFEDTINNDKNNSQKMYALDCLLEIKKDDPQYLQFLTNNTKLKTPELQKHMNAKIGFYSKTVVTQAETETQFGRTDVFINDQDYIPLKGGQFDYSVNGSVEDIPDIYFGKYPVTNKSYRWFIDYLHNRDIHQAAERLPLKTYFNKLFEFAQTIEGFSEYLGKSISINDLPGKLISKYDDDRKFNSDVQPVVGVSWYDAKAYCLWLSLFEAAGGKDGLDKPLQEIAEIYRLPKDKEWERAAKGIKTDKSYPRKYPWGVYDPTPELANFDRNIGKTTPVDRYPNGETPDGIMDMAGNVWEWVEDKYDTNRSGRVFRGGSWCHDTGFLVSSFRLRYDPQDWSNVIGFRVVRPSL